MFYFLFILVSIFALYALWFGVTVLREKVLRPGILGLLTFLGMAAVLAIYAWAHGAGHLSSPVAQAIQLVVVVDDDIDIRNPADVEWALAKRWDASKGLILMPNSRGHEYVPIFEEGVRTKAGIDATLPYGFSKRHKRILFPPADLSKYKTSLTPEFQDGLKFKGR